ncbi:MAG: hypothetical protein ACFFEV_10300 [Candidatus Thorarchaeota archaeon]
MARLAKEEVEKLQRDLKQSVLLDDKFTWFIISLKGDSFPTNPNILHSAFYKLRKEWKEISELTYKRIHPSFYSEDLDSLLFRMELAGLISCGNPNYQEFGIHAERKEKLRKRLETRLPEETKLAMENVAKGFEDFLKTA